MKHMKKLLSLALALVICLSLAVPAFAASGFSDVPDNAYYAKAVSWAVEQGLVKGTSSTTFSPGDSCTVAQILTFLWRGAGRPGATSANMAWTDELVAVENWAKAKGITYPLLNGYCGRDEAVEFMWRAAGCPNPTVTAEFEDVPPYASYAKAVSWALEKGITNGTGSLTFSPNTICSRGDIVTFLYREAVEPLETTLPSREVMLTEIVRLINAERAKEGLAPVATYSTLTAAAQLRSKEVTQSVSKTRPDGTSYTTALAETGADQNVVASNELPVRGQSVPTGLLSHIRSTPEFKAAILNPEFTHVGVGYTYSPYGKASGSYWSIIFVRVNGSPNSAAAAPNISKSIPQYDENGVLVSTDPFIKLTALSIDKMKEPTATTSSRGYTALLMDDDWWCDYHGRRYTVSWKAGDPSIVSLEEKVSNGIVTGVFINALKAGKTTITCTVTGQDGYSAEAYCYVTVQPSTTSGTTPSTGMTAEQMCARVVELVNQERAKQGLSPLSTMTNLTAAANIRAPELVTLFDHNRPNGTKCYTALSEANVTGYFTAGENIAAGYRTPEAVMNGWMNSPGHRANILNSSFTHIGVGYYNGYWVQMFIGRR